MNNLKSRGVKDVYMLYVDGLTEFKEAINTVFYNSSDLFYNKIYEL